jgi:putative SOS response-associated peptidase YedK
MRWGMPPPPRTGGPPVTNIRNTSSPHWRSWLKPENRCLVPFNSFAEYAPSRPRWLKRIVMPSQLTARLSRWGGSQRETLVSGTRHKEARLV